MRRTEIIEGVEQILDAIKESEILEVFSLAQRAPARVDPDSASTMLKSLRAYSIRAHSFNSAAKEITRILDIHELDDPSLWARLVIPDEKHSNMGLFWSLRFADHSLPKIISLIKPSEFESSLVEGAGKSGLKHLSVLVFEPQNTLSSPVRLANVLESINHFYTACALMGKESPSTLSVSACDSGSDKSFDFLGLASVMECVEKIITTIWDRVFFYREYQFEERLDLISKSLPILTEITRMELHKEIEPELAEILKRNIFDGTNKFVQSGATIPQIENKADYDARRLLSPVQRLLVSPSAETLEEDARRISQSEAGSAALDEMDLTKLTAEEQKVLQKLFEKTVNPGESEPEESKTSNGDN